MQNTPSIANRWSSRLLFILVSTAAAVGLGNIWKFPYIAGENGGGAFVIVYLICIAIIGIPVMIAEVLIGRRGRHTPGYSTLKLAKESGRHSAWQITGWLGMATGFLVLSFYTVIAGWALAYIFEAAQGAFTGATVAEINQLFEQLTGSVERLTFWHALIMLGVAIVVGKGLREGLERTVSWMLPLMVLLLIVLSIYAGYIGDFGAAVAFMFAPDFSKLTIDSVLVALGHAFFSLGLASGVVIMYGAYLSKSTSIIGTSIWVAIADTVVALLAGMAIFPIVFGSQLEPGAGPGLIFQTLPIAFSHMPGGAFVGTLFFIMLVIAAFTSAIAMIESSVAFCEECFGLTRWRATFLATGTLWALGQLTIYSFGGANWAQLGWQIEGKTFGTLFDLIDYVTGSILLPIGGLLLALFVGWVMKTQYTQDELNTASVRFKVWHFIVRYIAPIAIILIFLQLIGIIQF
ncbi:neurotransmitter:Na+ symporter, NSS family [Pseudidiomarina indica]|uniref:Transporter n=1 Tax=Pseudidiomarina indica TaxID=1159017 RepID=A0A1G6A6C9_9GAMM|nr:sodium-dependent transporter [Pseudidiomarina indica]SDB03955.1 neurotransmitter:Na+ symporter, NSS family [Pseudidiomarina indica]